MLSNLSPLLARVNTYVKPEDLLLQKGSWVNFSNLFTQPWAKGNLFEVAEEPVLVRYARSYTLPASDWKDLDLSNATNGLNLYPGDEDVLYQIAIGFKPGEYLTHVYIPKDKPIYRLGESSMYPVTDSGSTDYATLKYLGAYNPGDSPYDSPLLFLYAIKDVTAFYLRPLILEGVDYDKVTIGFYINKCKLKEIEKPSKEQLERAKRIEYYTEMTGH
jgi:hypothetical protein